MRSKLAPSAANFLKYGASDLPPRICSKFLFSSITITMWSYTGSVAGQAGLSAASAVLAMHNTTMAMVQRWDVFVICLPYRRSALRLQAIQSSGFEPIQSHADTGPAMAVLSLRQL